MRNSIIKITLLLTILFSFTSCEVIGGIFKAGMGFGIFLVVAIIILFVFLLSRLFGKK